MMQEVEDKVEGIEFMSFRVFWFVVAGFVLGFVTSTLWEWLYYRQKRIQSLASHGTTLLDARRSHGAEPEDDAEDAFDVNEWKLPSYRGSGVLLENEEHSIAPNLTGMPSAVTTQPKPVPPAQPVAHSPDPDAAAPLRPFVTNAVEQAQESLRPGAPTAEELFPPPPPTTESTQPTPSTTERIAPALASLQNRLEQVPATGMTEHLSGAPANEDDDRSTGNSQAIARATALAAATLGSTRAASVQKQEEAQAAADLAPKTANDQDVNGQNVNAQDAKMQDVSAQNVNRQEHAVEATSNVERFATVRQAPALTQDPSASPLSPLSTQPFVRRPTDYPDDLAMIKGIGEAYKRRLYASGIYTWLQLAESDTDSLRRITRAKPNADIESWQTVAHALAEKYQRTEANFNGPLDDFTRIEGIGAITADMLYKAGICVYEQLAALLPDELARIVPAPTVGKENDFDGWINDATRLASSKRRNNGLLS